MSLGLSGLGCFVEPVALYVRLPGFVIWPVALRFTLIFFLHMFSHLGGRWERGPGAQGEGDQGRGATGAGGAWVEVALGGQGQDSFGSE